MHTLVFRFREVIMEIDEARLVEDFCFDLEKRNGSSRPFGGSSKTTRSEPPKK